MKTIILIALALMLAGSLGAIPQSLPQELNYDKTITPPADYFGFEEGQRHLTHAQLLGYLQLVADQSDRVELIEYGRTHGHRRLVQVLISSPENLARADEIAASNRALANPSKSRKLDLNKMPVVVNLNYSVHGNEASGATASPAIVYYLAAGQGKEMEALLSGTVVLLDPCLNPDGFDRFANWTNNHVGKNPNPDRNTREHHETWPNGRTNYYWFDLNRDWMLLTQPESRGRMELYHHWLPNFVLDYHEMYTNQTYFFQPGVPERAHPLIPESVKTLTEKISHYFAEALDASGSLYFSKERFDDFYMGKGSTITDLKGAIGMLCEQATARGIVQNSANGPLTFAFAIQNQVTSSLAVLKAAKDLRMEFLEHTREFYRESMEMAKEAGIAGYRFASPGDPARADEFVNVLRGHDIEVQPIADEAAWYIPARQAQYRYLQALVEQRKDFEENIFYDITAWTLPLAYNLDWAALQKAPTTSVSEKPVASLEQSSLGYLVDWSKLNAPRLLFDLMGEGIVVHVAKKPFTLKGQSFGHGALFIPLSQNRGKADLIHKVLDNGVQKFGLRVVPVSTFLTEDGIDLGSSSIVPLKTPKILLVAGQGIAGYTAGSIWHLIDVLHDYPVTLVDPRRLDRINLSDYTALVLPGSKSGTYSEALSERLKPWVESGGTVVCLGSDVKWASVSGMVGLSMVQTVQPAEGLSQQPRRPFARSADDKALEDIKGAIFRAEVDNTHPLAFGFSGAHLPVFVEMKDFINPSSNPYQTPLIFAANPLLAGYASEENLGKMTGSAAAAVDIQGKGAVVLFGFNPTFRAYWRGTEKLLLNAILFGPIMKAD